MAKGIYGGVGGVVKKVKKVPLGIGGVVKEAKKGYCGVGGVVKEFYSSELVIYDHGLDPFNLVSVFPSGFEFTKNSDHIVFDQNSSGGWTSGTYRKYFSWPVMSEQTLGVNTLDSYTQFVMTVDTLGYRPYYDHNFAIGFEFGSIDYYTDIDIRFDDSSETTGITGQRNIIIPLTDSFKSDFNTNYASNGEAYFRFRYGYSVNDGTNYYRPFNLYYMAFK